MLGAFGLRPELRRLPLRGGEQRHALHLGLLGQLRVLKRQLLRRRVQHALLCE